MHFNLHMPHMPHMTTFTHVVDQVHDFLKHYKHEKESEAHQVCIYLELLFFGFLHNSKIYRQSAGHQPKGFYPETVNPVRSASPRITGILLSMQPNRMRKPSQEFSIRGALASSIVQTVL
jgi:hypothetical protein